MPARRESMGINRWFRPTDGDTWNTGYSAGSGINLWRIGTPAQIEALAGLAIRGWTITGSVSGPIRSPIELLAFNGCAYPPPQATLTASNRNFSMLRAESVAPIGVVTAIGGHLVDSPDWIGLQTTGYVTRRESDSVPFPIMGEFTVLVSPKPHWTHTAPATLDVAAEAIVTVTIAYADGQRVNGLDLQLLAGGRSEVRGASGGFGPAAIARTNVNGIATFRVRGLTAGNESLTLATSPHIAFAESPYTPAFPATIPIQIRAPIVLVPGHCYTVPGQPYIAPIPDRYEPEPIRAWDAGANSVDELDGDVSLRFDTSNAVGVVLGLTQDRDLEDIGTLARITHGFYFHTTAAGQPVFQIIEAGKTVTPVAPHDAAEEFEVRRVQGVVLYFKDAVKLYQSRVPSTGMVSAGSALYATGDTTP